MCPETIRRFVQVHANESVFSRNYSFFPQDFR
jgi:hypothetical protein